jgi:DNA-binding beta-propeller fold protein YncE
MFCQQCGTITETAGKCPQCGGTVLELETHAVPDLDLSAPRMPTDSDPNLPTVKARETLRIEQTVLGEGPGRLQAPFSVVIAPDGSFYVLDVDGADAYRILQFGADGGFRKLIARVGSGDGPGQIKNPYGIALDPEGRLWLPDSAHDRIVRFSTDGRIDRTLGPDTPTGAPLCCPRDVDIDPAGNVYVADSLNNRVLKFDPAGKCPLVLGINEDLDDDDCLDAGSEPGEFDEPGGITADASGNVYVCDTNNHRMQVFSADGALRTAFGSEGTALGRFVFPADVRVNREGFIYVADQRNTRVQKFNLSGIPIAYFAPAQGAQDGAGAVGDVDIDDQGRVLVPLPDKGVIVRASLREIS